MKGAGAIESVSPDRLIESACGLDWRREREGNIGLEKKERISY